jgi:hypothetical protein
MKTLFTFVLSFGVIAGLAVAQEPPKPGKEHEKLKAMEGTWDCAMKMMGADSKGSMTYKMAIGGLWLESNFTGDLGGMKFEGKGLDSYDAGKKKYVGYWFDSFSTGAMIMEGNYDESGKVMTMTGEGPGPDGKMMKYKIITTNVDADTMNWTMSQGGADGKFTETGAMSLKRKK